MGIYDREYYRESTKDRLSEWFAQRGTVGLVFVTGVVYLAQLLTRASPFDGDDLLSRWGAFDLPRILDGELWRFVTPVFLHDSAAPTHFLFNMIALYWFGTIIEGVYGTKEFVCFYVVAGILVEVAEFAARYAGLLPADVRSLGASGAVTAVMVLMACHFPNRQLQFWFVIPAPAWVVVCVMIALDVLGVMGLRPGRINFIAHLFGAAIGFVYYFTQLRLSPYLIPLNLWSVSRAPRLKQKITSAVESEPVVPAAKLTTEPAPARGDGPVDEQLEAKLDYVLEKVSRSGKESLTPEENDILLRASEIFKKRRGP